MTGNDAKKINQIKLPYGNVSWYTTFFELIHSKSFVKFDKSIIELNIVKGDNAGRLFRGIKFLGLVKEDGTVTEAFKSLRKTGDEFKNNLKVIVKEAYGDLFDKIVISKANSENLYNYMVEYCGYGKTLATRATKIFIFLCKEAEIDISPELAEGQVNISKSKQRKNETKNRKKKKQEKSEKVSSSNMHEAIWGTDIIINLRKGDRKAREKIAKIAKTLIQMYVEDAEETKAKED